MVILYYHNSSQFANNMIGIATALGVVVVGGGGHKETM